MLVMALCTLAAIHAMLAQDVVEQCPEPNGFFADAVQCDRYYECKDGRITDHVCADGLVFDESGSTVFAKCSFPFSVDCSERPELQPARPTPLCPRQNGYFAHEDPKVCDKFYFCVDGVANGITCPSGLIFSPDTGQCAYTDQVKRNGCSSSDVFHFQCPDNPITKHAHPRYPDPDDCQYFYVCIDGTDARRSGCTQGLVFNNETSSCDHQENVRDPVCSHWYNDTYLSEVIQARPKTGGVPLTPEQQRDRVVVRRRKPVAQVPQLEGAGPASELPAAVQPDQKQRVPLQPQQQQHFTHTPQTRTRVRVTGQVRGHVQPEIEDHGPPSFVLASDEAIQKFRDANKFSPLRSGGHGGRLTFLPSPSSAVRPEIMEEGAEQDELEQRPPGHGSSRFRQPPKAAGDSVTSAALPERRLQISDVRVRPDPSAFGNSRTSEKFPTFDNFALSSTD